MLYLWILQEDYFFLPSSKKRQKYYTHELKNSYARAHTHIHTHTLFRQLIGVLLYTSWERDQVSFRKKHNSNYCLDKGSVHNTSHYFQHVSVLQMTFTCWMTSTWRLTSILAECPCFYAEENVTFFVKGKT